MAVKLKAEIKITGILGMKPKDFRHTFLRPMYEHMGEFWMTKIRPKHFTREGAREYGYAKRRGEDGSGRRFKGSYYARKKAKGIADQPLVFTGELKHASTYARWQHRKDGMDIVLPKARKANWRHPLSKIDMNAELTTVSQGDARQLLRAGNSYLVRRLRNFPRTAIIRVA